jgi:hypothetical protein
MLTIWVLFIVAHTWTEQAAAQIPDRPYLDRATCEQAAGDRVHVCIPMEKDQ